MAEFLDTQTGRTIQATGARADYFRQSPARFQEQGRSVSTDDVPDGTIAEVLDWVGDDELRRVAALMAEQHESGKQRSTLIEKLDA